MKIDKHNQRNIKLNENNILFFKSNFKKSAQKTNSYEFEKRRTAMIIIFNQK